MNRYDRQARTMLLWVVVICLSFLAFALGVWCGEKDAPEYTAEEPQIAAVPEAVPRWEPVEGDPSAAPQDDKNKAPQDDKGKAPEDDSAVEEPYADPMCEDSYLMVDHPLPLDKQVMLYGACLEFGVDWKLALAVVEQETGFRNLMGDDGESAGYMQVQEKWHQERMALLGVDDLMDPEGNFRVGCHFLRECIDKYGLEKGLGYYNSGQAVVTDYSLQVLGRMQNG